MGGGHRARLWAAPMGDGNPPPPQHLGLWLCAPKCSVCTGGGGAEWYPNAVTPPPPLSPPPSPAQFVPSPCNSMGRCGGGTARCPPPIPPLTRAPGGRCHPSGTPPTPSRMQWGWGMRCVEGGARRGGTMWGPPETSPAGTDRTQSQGAALCWAAAWGGGGGGVMGRGSPGGDLPPPPPQALTTSGSSAVLC